MYKLIIFDVDGTFYDLEDVVRDNYNIQLSFFMEHRGLNEAEAKKIFEENSILPYKSSKARSATEFFLRCGIDATVWTSYRNFHTSPKSIRRDSAVRNETLLNYTRLTSAVLLSSNTLDNIRQTLDWLRIDKAQFDNIYCSSSKELPQPFRKETAVAYILSRFDLSPSQVLAVGDRYDTDIKPLVSLGGDGVLIHSPKALERIYADLTEGNLGVSQDPSYELYSPHRKE